MGDKVFYVHAVCVEVDGTPYALELVSPIRMEDLRGDEDASVLNQLLLRNRQVYIDSATHVYNRRYFDDRLRDLDGEFTLAMLDLDHFKRINDTYGHLAGDAALSRAAQAIRSAIRTGDELVRYGGDEFLLLFHGMPRNALKKKLESIRAAVESLEFPEYPGLRITVSIGGAHAVGPLADTVQKGGPGTLPCQGRQKLYCALQGGPPMTIREFYTLVGGSYDDMSERFPSDALILRFLTMLPQDGSMELLARSMDAADAKTAFRAVHTLKGVALNLGLTALAGVCSEMTEALRGSDTLPASAPALFEAVQREYDKVTGALVQLTA